MNLKVRLKQKWFWITLIPLLFLLFDQIMGCVAAIQSITLGTAIYESPLMALVLQIIGVVFAILALIGFPVDLTTEGYMDSERAMDYTDPAPRNLPAAKVTKNTKNAKKAK